MCFPRACMNRFERRGIVGCQHTTLWRTAQWVPKRHVISPLDWRPFGGKSNSCSSNHGALDPTAWAVEAVEPGSDFPRSKVGVIMARVKPGTPGQYTPMPAPISIVDAARELRAGKLTPLELLDRCLEQMREHEDAVHAWVLVDEVGARQTATQRTREAALAQWRGPLHGIPVGIKDIIDVQGLATGAGSPLCGHQPAAADAPLVAALRRAGAVILGKTVTVEFACFDPSPTRNPWNLAHTPGGSSSGSAAALAMGMCLGALGTQTGGSLVRPSAYCGVATCKPTFGKLSTEGIVPVSAEPGPCRPDGPQGRRSRPAP